MKFLFIALFFTVSAQAADLGFFIDSKNELDSVRRVVTSADELTLVISLESKSSVSYKATSKKGLYSSSIGSAEILDVTAILLTNGSTEVLLTKIDTAAVEKLREQKREDLQRAEDAKLKEKEIFENAPVHNICTSSWNSCQGDVCMYTVRATVMKGSKEIASRTLGSQLTKAEVLTLMNSDLCK